MLLFFILIMYICLGINYLFMLKTFIIVLVVAVVMVLLFWKFWFCRKPERTVPDGDVIVSPANGKIVNIIEFDQEKLTIEKGKWGKISTLVDDVSKEGTLVSIMMTPLNVHFQRAPFDGKVIDKKYVPGKFLDAVKDAKEMKATLENEHNEILFELKNRLKIKVIQIAGFLARRIHDFVEIGQSVEKGQEIGFIDLGSQVTIILPKEIEVVAKVGDVVIDGESIIGQLR